MAKRDLPEVQIKGQDATFAKNKGKEFANVLSNELLPAAEQFQNAENKASQHFFKIAEKALKLAKNSGYDGKAARGEADSKWPYVEAFYKALSKPFEDSIKEATGSSRVVDVYPSYSVLKSETLRHMRTGRHELSAKQAEDEGIASDDRLVSTGNPIDCKGFSDMKSRTRKVEHYRKKATQAGQGSAESNSGSASGSEPEAAGNTADQTPPSDDMPASVAKAAGDIMRELNGVENWDKELEQKALGVLYSTRDQIASLGLPDDESEPGPAAAKAS